MYNSVSLQSRIHFYWNSLWGGKLKTSTDWIQIVSKKALLHFYLQVILLFILVTYITHMLCYRINSFIYKIKPANRLKEKWDLFNQDETLVCKSRAGCPVQMVAKSVGADGRIVTILCKFLYVLGFKIENTVRDQSGVFHPTTSLILRIQSVLLGMLVAFSLHHAAVNFVCL